MQSKTCFSTLWGSVETEINFIDFRPLHYFISWNGMLNVVKIINKTDWVQYYKQQSKRETLHILCYVENMLFSVFNRTQGWHSGRI
jgi:hypothetical protein